MDGLKRVQLCIVDTECVRPHEIADPARERNIKARLESDGVLRDPLMVGAVPDLDGYVLLDGTNRKQALAALGVSRVMVQVIDYADPHSVHVRTWCHAATRSIADLLQGAAPIPGLVTAPLPPLATPDALRDSRTLAVLLDQSERYTLSRLPDHEASRHHQLRQLVDLYEDRMSRVSCDPDEVEERARTLGRGDGSRTLVAFPPFSRSQVVALAMGGNLIPAGITRHVILGGRALRVNLPLTGLDGSHSLDEANAALQQHLSTLQPRIYTEPTVLYDS